MKLNRALIENFKGVKHLEIDFTSTTSGQPRPLTCLIGDNGSGKTTVMQAIALTLSLATYRTKAPTAFDWQGFQVERVGSLGKTRVDLEVEIDATEQRAAVELWAAYGAPREEEWVSVRDAAATGSNPVVHVAYEGTPFRGVPTTNVKFLGRHMINVVAQTHPEEKKRLSEFGDVFWFTQDRNIGWGHNGASRGAWQANVERLREMLVAWWAIHKSRPETAEGDHITLLEQHFNRVFPGTKFVGVQERLNTTEPGPKDVYFLLERDGKVYDIAEMSSGEQAVFPLIFEFTRQNIAKSVVLIDELELHLHPPQQQALLAALRKLGPDCQFIISTHSRHLEGVIPDEEEVRLPGGRRCL